MKKQVNLVTFGGGKSKYHKAAYRLKQEATALNFFDSIFAVTDKQLKSEHPQFWKQHEGFMRQHSRGFGYWLWKPYLVNYFLKNSPLDSLLVYIDAGCTLNPNGIERLKQYCKMADEKECLVFQMASAVEQNWSKRDTIDAINPLPEDALSGQIIGTAFFIKNTSSMQKLAAEWLDFATSHHYHLLDDSPSLQMNVPGFIEHRHDQSIFSLLIKKWSSKHDFAILPDETYFEPNWFTKGIQYPIWATRHKAGASFNK